MSSPSRASGLWPRFPLAGLMAMIAALYLGREFIIPLVLAALIAFSLSPVVRWLERRHIPRLASVLSVCFAVTLLLGGIGWVVVAQMADFARQLPHYRTNLLGKVEQLKSQSRGPWSGAAATITEVMDSLEENTSRLMSSKGRMPAVPVQVVAPDTSAVKEVGNGLATIAGPFGTGAIVAVLVIFMLLARDNLRDRLVHLARQGSFRITHQATAEAGRRVSRYLLAQTVVNVLYGSMVWGAMAAIGVPNAALWGLVGAVLRYLPYLGPAISFVLPLAVSLAVAPTWAIPLWVIAAFVVIELVVNNVLEPMFYSSSTGLSPLAVIVSAMFWSWLWGPLGLVLATPLTVCALVLGRQIPSLSFMDVLLSDDPPITPAERFYQRLLGDSDNDALKVLAESHEDATLTEALDDFVLPAVASAHAAAHDGDLDPAVEDRVYAALRRLLPRIASAFEEEVDGGSTVRAEATASMARVLIVPLSHETDALAGEVLQCALRSRQVHSSLLEHGLLRSEKADLIRSGEDVSIAVLVATVEESARAARMLSRSISASGSSIKTHVLLCLGEMDKQEKWKEQLSRSDATDVATSLTGAVKNVLAWVSTLPAPTTPRDAAAPLLRSLPPAA